MTKKPKYEVVGSKKNGFAILEDGGVLYDLIETSEGAKAIQAALRDGVDAEWNTLSVELEKRGQQVDFL